MMLQIQRELWASRRNVPEKHEYQVLFIVSREIFIQYRWYSMLMMFDVSAIKSLSLKINLTFSRTKHNNLTVTVSAAESACENLWKISYQINPLEGISIISFMAFVIHEAEATINKNDDGRNLCEITLQSLWCHCRQSRDKWILIFMNL